MVNGRNKDSSFSSDCVIATRCVGGRQASRWEEGKEVGARAKLITLRWNLAGQGLFEKYCGNWHPCACARERARACLSPLLLRWSESRLRVRIEYVHDAPLMQAILQCLSPFHSPDATGC